MLKAAEPPVGARMVAKARPAGLDRLFQHSLDARDEGDGLCRCLAGLSGNGARQAEGREARAEKRLADIDIAEACDEPLIEQSSLDGGLLALELAGEPGRSEILA